MLVEAFIGGCVFLLMWWYFKEEDPLDKLPSPPRLPLIGNTIQILKIPNDKILDVLVDYTKKYGDRYVVHVLGQRHLHISGPSDIEAILSHSKNISKSLPYSFLTGWLGNGLLLSTGAHWHKRRKILTSTFHFNILKNFSIVFEEKTKDLVNLLREKNGTEVEVMPVISDFTLFAICDRKAHRQDNKVEEENSEGDFGTKRRLALLDLLLEAEAKGEIDIEGVRDEVNTFMFGGHDTTALAMTHGLMILADHDDIQDRIFEEVQSILGGVDRQVTASDLADMKYLEAVIKEILRLYPSVPFVGRQVSEDFMMGDVLVKKGTAVDVHIYDVHRREDLFPDAEAFKPERFIGTTLKHPYAFVPFSAGPRNCIGQRYAMQEMKMTLSEIIRNFKLVPKVKGTRPRLIADALVLRSADPIYVKFISRK